MPKQYNDNNRGVLFINEKKQDPKHPDFTGKLDVNGSEYFLDAWKQEGKNGKKGFLSVRIKPKNGPSGGISGRRDEFDL